MAKRVPLIAGNWKMYKGGRAGVDLARGVADYAKSVRGVDMVVAPPFTALTAMPYPPRPHGKQ